jgi:hypothetical protein
MLFIAVKSLVFCDFDRKQIKYETIARIQSFSGVEDENGPTYPGEEIVVRTTEPLSNQSVLDLLWSLEAEEYHLPTPKLHLREAA